MSVKMRQEIERKIIAQIVDSAFANGYSISVNDGEETVLKKSTNKTQIMNAIMSTDEDVLYIHDKAGARLGSVYLIYGNDGHDVIADYTAGLESLLEEANKLADAYAD